MQRRVKTSQVSTSLHDLEDVFDYEQGGNVLTHDEMVRLESTINGLEAVVERVTDELDEVRFQRNLVCMVSLVIMLASVGIVLNG